MTPTSAPTEAVVALVPTAWLGANMTRHRLLLNAVTACGILVGPAWHRAPGLLEEVTCPVCSESYRQMRARRPR